MIGAAANLWNDGPHSPAATSSRAVWPTSTLT